MPAMITLHYYPGNASFAPHVLLHELGTPFQLQLLDRSRQAQRSPEFLKLNPNGFIPVLVDGDLVVYETAAVLLHLADTPAGAGLAPPVGSAERAHYYKWMLWLSNTMQAAMSPYSYPERWVAPGNVEAATQVRAAAETRLGGCLAQIDAQLAGHGGPWLLGASYSAADPLAFMLCRWTRNFASQPARDYAHIGPYLQRMLARPAVQAAVAAERLQPPLV